MTCPHCGGDVHICTVGHPDCIWALWAVMYIETHKDVAALANIASLLRQAHGVGTYDAVTGIVKWLREEAEICNNLRSMSACRIAADEIERGHWKLERCGNCLCSRCQCAALKDLDE